MVIGSSLTTHPFAGTTTRELSVEGRLGPATVEVHERADLVVVMRHGPTGRVPGRLVDHHANVRALCEAGCDRVLALGSAGGLHGHLGPGTVVAPDDFLAFGPQPTYHHTTDGYRMAAIDAGRRATVLAAWAAAASTPIVDGGTYAMVSGPRFETPAEIRMLATFADLVGMTWPAECVLACEAGLRYAVMCKVDNLANGVEGHRASVEEYLARTAADAERLSADLVAVVEVCSPCSPGLRTRGGHRSVAAPRGRSCGCPRGAGRSAGEGGGDHCRLDGRGGRGRRRRRGGGRRCHTADHGEVLDEVLGRGHEAQLADIGDGAGGRVDGGEVGLGDVEGARAVEGEAGGAARADLGEQQRLRPGGRVDLVEAAVIADPVEDAGRGVEGEATDALVGRTDVGHRGGGLVHRGEDRAGAVGVVVGDEEAPVPGCTSSPVGSSSSIQPTTVAAPVSGSST